MTVRGCREDITWWWSGSVSAPWPPWVRTGSRLCAGASGPRGPSSPAGPTQTREWEPLTLTANQRACWETAGNLQSLQSLIQKQKLVTITLDECEAPAEWSVFHFISHLAEAPTPQVSAYLVVGPDGDFELRQDSLHLQVPLCRVDRRLQDLVGFGGRLSFLPENRRRGEFKARSERESGNYDVILFWGDLTVWVLRNFRASRSITFSSSSSPSSWSHTKQSWDVKTIHGSTRAALSIKNTQNTVMTIYSIMISALKCDGLYKTREIFCNKIHEIMFLK